MSSATLRYYESFNTKLEEFIGDLSATFPELNDIKSIKTSFVFAKSMNPRMPQQLFKSYVADKFGEKIMARDEGFFLEHDYKDVLDDSGMISGFDKSSVDIIGQLKTMWKDMSTVNKDAVWKYLAVLVYLSDKCTEASGK